MKFKTVQDLSESYKGEITTQPSLTDPDYNPMSILEYMEYYRMLPSRQEYDLNDDIDKEIDDYVEEKNIEENYSDTLYNTSFERKQEEIKQPIIEEKNKENQEKVVDNKE